MRRLAVVRNPFSFSNSMANMRENPLGFRLRRATQTDFPKIARFLTENELPTNGVQKFIENFVIAADDSDSWIGVAGLEVYGKSGLMRSVAVDRQFRGLHHGRTLVNAVLNDAGAKGIENVYLLTDSAEGYFKRLGFEVVKREDVDEEVKESPEFTEICETATVMRRLIR